MPSPRVSVIIPVFNTEVYVEDALATIQAQTFTDFEVICVDDGSTDGSVEILERCAADDDRIRIIRLGSNQGISVARNRAIDSATGDYVYCFDSDDRLAPTALETLVDAADRDDLDVVYFNVEPFFEDGIPEALCAAYRAYYARLQSYPGVVTGSALFTEMAMHDEWLPGPCTYMCRRSYLNESGLKFPEGIFHEDQYYSFAVAMQARRVKHVPEIFFGRRLRANSLVTSTPGGRHVAGLIEAYAHALALADRLGVDADSDLGVSISREMGKTYADAVQKFNRLTPEERTWFNERRQSDFAAKEAISRMRTDAEREGELEMLQAAGLRIAALERSWPRRIARRLRLAQ